MHKICFGNMNDVLDVQQILEELLFVFRDGVGHVHPAVQDAQAMEYLP
ncbi:hypothetical protein [Robertkochia marina]|nr:hypothetical protein [Robertkochia marina]